MLPNVSFSNNFGWLIPKYVLFVKYKLLLVLISRLNQKGTIDLTFIDLHEIHNRRGLFLTHNPFHSHTRH